MIDQEDPIEPCHYCGKHCPGWTTLTCDPLDPKSSMAYFTCTDCWEARSAKAKGDPDDTSA